jgi:hypothetical protein
MIHNYVHFGIHLVVPLIVALIGYKKQWFKSFLILLSAFIIDLDHLLATPIFDANRCSIDFHPLHSYGAIGIYICLLVPSKTRLFGLGLCIHILADSYACLVV